MNRREMLASLMALPFVPSFLKAAKPIRGKSLAEIDGVQVIARCKPGTVFLPNKKGGWTRQAWSQGMQLPLEIIKHTPYRTTVECEVPCVITNLFYRGQDMVYALLEDDSSILVRRGDFLRVDIWHHHHNTIWFDGEQKDYATPTANPPLLALLAANREIADTLQGYKPGTAPWDPTQIFWTPYRNRLQYYCESQLAAQQGWADSHSRKVKISLA